MGIRASLEPHGGVSGGGSRVRLYKHDIQSGMLHGLRAMFIFSMPTDHLGFSLTVVLTYLQIQLHCILLLLLLLVFDCGTTDYCNTQTEVNQTDDKVNKFV